MRTSDSKSAGRVHPWQASFVEAVNSVVQTARDDVIVASGSGSRTAKGLQSARRKILAALGILMGTRRSGKEAVQTTVCGFRRMFVTRSEIASENEWLK